jgi:hypothetical protein
MNDPMAELDALIAAGYGDTPRAEVPADWRERGPKVRTGKPRKPRKRERLDLMAARMRAHYLTHGQGCKTQARAIASRTKGASA